MTLHCDGASEWRDTHRGDGAAFVPTPPVAEEELDGPPALWQLPDYWCLDPSNCMVAMPGGGRCDCFGITVAATSCVYDRADNEADSRE
jgi:hypothetical protein